jgi:hypothetical protein
MSDAPSPILPENKQRILPTDTQSVEMDHKSHTGDLSNSPWAQMFPQGATKKELTQFIGMFLKDLVSQMKHQDEIHKQHMQEIKAQIEGS